MPTKKQRELLNFIDTFTRAHGYSPSYREIMQSLDYKSVSTVAVHINSLIARGQLLKRPGSARSLEVIRQPNQPERLPPTPKAPFVTSAQEKWLVELISRQFTSVEQAPTRSEKMLEELYILIGALRILGFEGAALTFHARLKTIPAQPHQSAH